MRRVFYSACVASAIVLLLAGPLCAQGEDPGTLTIGYSATMLLSVDKNDAQAAVRVWAKTLIDDTGISVGSEAFVFHDLPTLAQSIQDRRIDAVVLPALEYVKARETIPLVPAVIGTTRESAYYEYILLVRRSSDVEEIDRLRGKVLLADQGAGGDVSLMWLDTLLGEHGLPEARAFFGTVKDVGKVSQAVLPVFFGQADACLVSHGSFETMTELNPQLNSEMVILARSPKFARGPVCLREDIYQKYGDVLLNTLLTMHTQPSGQQILDLFQSDRLVPWDPSHMESIVALMEEHERLKAGVKP